MHTRRDNRVGRQRYRQIAAACLVLIAGVVVGLCAPHHAQEQSAAKDPNALVAKWIDKSPAKGAPQPMGSEDASLIYDPIGSRAILFGGKDDADISLTETWALDASRTWKRVTTTGKTPPASEDHTTIYDPAGHRMLMYGGENGPTTNKLWSLDLKTAAWKDMTNPQVPRRESHTAVYDSKGKRMIVFGGIDRTREDLFDVWAMDLDPASPTFEKWKELVTEGRPPGRIDHAAIYDPVKNRMVIHGGWMKTRQGLLGDTWALYFADTPDAPNRWERIDTASAPQPRRHGIGVYDPDRQLFILIAGQGRTTNALSDVWAFDLTRDVWMNLTPAERGPVGRIDHQAAYDSQAHLVVLYGGDSLVEDAPKLHDVWELTVSSGSHVSSSRGAQ